MRCWWLGWLVSTAACGSTKPVEGPAARAAPIDAAGPDAMPSPFPASWTACSIDADCTVVEVTCGTCPGSLSVAVTHAAEVASLHPSQDQCNLFPMIGVASCPGGTAACVASTCAKRDTMITVSGQTQGDVIPNDYRVIPAQP